MADPSRHPAALHDLPSFLPGPDGSDILLGVTAVLLIVLVLAFGLLFLRLHTLPERLAHRSQKLQFEMVAVLGLLALFTQIHLFWVLGLLLAFVNIPDFSGPMRRIAGSSEKLARLPPGEGDTLRDETGGLEQHHVHQHAGRSPRPLAGGLRAGRAPDRRE